MKIGNASCQNFGKIVVVGSNLTEYEASCKDDDLKYGLVSAAGCSGRATQHQAFVEESVTAFTSRPLRLSWRSCRCQNSRHSQFERRFQRVTSK